MKRISGVKSIGVVILVLCWPGGAWGMGDFFGKAKRSAQVALLRLRMGGISGQEMQAFTQIDESMIESIRKTEDPQGTIAYYLLFRGWEERNIVHAAASMQDGVLKNQKVTRLLLCERLFMREEVAVEVPLDPLYFEWIAALEKSGRYKS